MQTPDEESIKELEDLSSFIIDIIQAKVNMNIREQAKRNDNSVLTLQAKELVILAREIADKVLQRYFGPEI
ncbi:MAG: hypothetical protein BWY21_00278 [Parcubacteria group bacterium ADurb.Bin216]|jgi:hypothetical protein|nr:MAG: hypothetical protein BWY21_00278 [Parcubacteria group bacterium ADurb.Bin216]